VSEQNAKENIDLHPPLSDKTSFLLSKITSGNASKTIHLGFLIEQFKGRSFGGLLLILSILALLPIVSFIAGIIILLVGLQMLLGVTIPILPKFIMQQKVDKRSFEAFVDKVIPWLVRTEKYIRPRWLFFAHTIGQRLLGCLIFLLALVSLMPLPFSNMPPSIALILISLGILERDGVLITIGICISSVAISIGYFILLFVINSIELMV
tara:strand:+ start:12655 stop:13281 length:627 start_codon:yes stop_codon:yes gene_type:complete